MEKKLRSNNLIIHGVVNGDDSCLEGTVVDLLNNKLGVDINKNEIQQIYRLGKLKDEQHIRPIKLSLSNHKMKLKIMKEKKKLTGTTIFINDDLPKQLRIREAEKRRMRRESPERRGHKIPVAQSSNDLDDSIEKVTQVMKRSNRINSDTKNIAKN